MHYRQYIFGLIICVCCPAIVSSQATGGRYAYVQSIFARDKDLGFVDSISNMLTSQRGESIPLRVRVARQIRCQVSGGVNVQSGAESDKLEYGSKEWHQEKKKLNTMLWAGIVIVTILFTGIILVTIIRMGRHYRKRVTEDKKAEPTEYVDAWSQYRLEDDNDE